LLCAALTGCGDDNQTPHPDAPNIDAPHADAEPPDASGPVSACDMSNIKVVPAGGMTYSGDISMTATLADQTGTCMTPAGMPPAGFGQDVYKLVLGGTGKHELVIASGRAADTITGLDLVLVLKKDTCNGTEVLCANAAISFENISAEVDAGTYYLLVLVDNGANPQGGGAYNLSIRDRELIPENGACTAGSTTQACVRDLQCVGGTCQHPGVCNTVATDLTTTHTASGDTTTGMNQFTELCDFANASNDNLYRVNVPASQTTPFDIVVHVDPTMASQAMTPLVTIRQGDCFLRSSEKICSFQGQQGGAGVELLDQTTTGDWYFIADGINYGTGFGMPMGAYTIDARMRTLIAAGAACTNSDPSTACSGAGNGCYKGAAAQATCQAGTAALACADAVDITPMLTQMGGARVAAVSGFTRGRDPADFDFTGNTDSGGTGCQFEANHPGRVFKLTTAATAALDFSTDDPSTEFDSAIIVRSTDCMTGTVVDCNDDIALQPQAGLPNYKSHVAIASAAAGTYFIYVQGSFGLPNQQNPNNTSTGSRAYGNFVLHVSVTP
jgi:hypothetical protein